MGVDLTSRLDSLSPEKRALLLEKLRQKAQQADASGQAAGGSRAALPRRSDPSSYPLSFAQQRLWILSQLEPDSPFYNIALALRLTGPLDVSALAASLNAIVRRHEVLRAHFVTERGAPVQVIAPELHLALPVEDLAAEVAGGRLSAAEIERRADRIAREEAAAPFDLQRGPLVRARLLKLNPEEHLALLTIHHIVMDGWSTGVLIREIGLLYDGFRRTPETAGRPAVLPPLPIQYADYAAWQREQLRGEHLAAELAFWRDALTGLPPILELPTDRPRPAVQSVQGTTYSFEVSADLAAKLRVLARREGATLFQVLLAAYQSLLYRYTGQDDLCVGTPIANRIRPELEGLIGFFVNTLVMRAQFRTETRRDLSFREVLSQVRERGLEAQNHQDLPFDLLVDEFAPQRNLSITPVFQVMFSLETSAAQDALRLPGLTITPIETHSGTAKFDLTLFMSAAPPDERINEDEGFRGEGSGHLRGSFEYNTDLWSAASMARLAAHFIQILRGIVAEPDRPVIELPILTDQENHQILEEWNDTTTDYPRDRTLDQLFRARLAATPDRVAVVYGDTSLTFAELNRRANQVAHTLQSLGVGPEVLVGVYMERSADLIVALLGIIKAGGAYLPLDVDYPTERLAFMVKDGRTPVLLTQASLADRLTAITDRAERSLTVLQMDTERNILDAQPDRDPICRATPLNLAYVIYTSGSTGTPKGVAIPQQAISRLVFNTNYIELSAADRMAQVSNASFDAATFEIWGALLGGATLVGVSKDMALSAHDFARFLREQRISVLFLTTALFNHIAAEVPDAFASLGHLLFGGEAVDVRWVRHVLYHGAPRRLLHVYGPTESTTFTSWHLVTDVPENAKTVPIGRPLSNTQIYVLDRKLQVVPIGVAGELCIGGDGLADGYLNRPELTAEKFVPDPFWVAGDRLQVEGSPHNLQPLTIKPATVAGARLYRTGDLVRLLPDGSIEFLGRIDDQVKVRGFRIELGEIEAVLARHPSLGEVFVMVHEEGERRIVAYVVPQPGASVSVSDLRNYLKELLPDYMIPAVFVFMDALPLNPNGKVDRRALPTPDQTRPEMDHTYVAPRSPVERFLAQKWQEVLGLERIGVYDNFFELGGNSLQAAVLTNRMQEELGASAHVRALFMAPTIADLAMYLDEYYADAVARIVGISALPGPIEVAGTGDASGAAVGYTFEQKAALPTQVDETKIARFRRIVPPLPPRIETAEDVAAGRVPTDKNPPAVFVLSPPRSGSTLLRVMLAGNPRLFAPPELDLLSFNTLPERRAAFSGKYEFWLGGPLKAITELLGCTADEAVRRMDSLEAAGWSTKRFYRQLQEWIAASMEDAAPIPWAGQPRILVDKTPVYPMDPEILLRMEADFDQPRYIYLMRHPFATVYSFIEAKLEEMFFRHEHPFSIRELAELVYTVSHQNVLTFLQSIPAERQHRVWFEEMVSDPRAVMEGVCEFLQIEFHPDMLDPYKGDKMTSGVQPGKQMVGDFKFYLRNKIDSKAADRWKRFNDPGRAGSGDRLADITWEVGRQLGYEKPETEAGSATEAALGTQDTGVKMDALTHRHATAAELPSSITPRPAGAVAPLSYAQQRLWFLDQWEPGSPFYNVPAAVRLAGRLNLAALEHAINEIVRRHEVLRTTFETVSGAAVLRVATQVAIPLPVIDLRHLPAAERETEAQRLAAEEARRPFDLAAGPLLRGSLLQLGDNETIVLVTMHHIVSDGWSVGVFIRELAALYDAYSAARPSPLAPLSIQYADYAIWQRSWLEARPGTDDASLQRQLTYWRQKLAGLPPLLELPTDRPRPAVQTLNGARHTFRLSPDLTAELKSLSRKHGATLFMTLLAAFQTLLHRYTGQDDIPVGTPIAGRNRPEIESLIGFFVNTLVMRGNLTPEPGASPAPTFLELLRRTQQTAIEAYDNQDVPFETVVEALGVPREMSHTPLFQAMFALQDAPLRTLKMPGLTITPMQPDTKTAKFDLVLNIAERADELWGALEYNTDLFNASTAAHMAGHLETLLTGIVAVPAQPISNLPLLTAAEQETLLHTWNDTAVDVTTGERDGATLHARIAAQTARTPASLAVVAPENGAQLTYAELDARAGRLAARLHSLGVGPDSVVGLLSARSVDMVVGLLGILKAGGAYLPLDPTYPADRLTFMLEDSGARVLVAEERLLENWKPEAGYLDEIVLLSHYVEPPPTSGGHVPASGFQLGEAPLRTASAISPDSLAYVIYTSGSTGWPKGVMVSHRAALNLAAALQRAAYAHSPLDRPLRLSLNAPLAFDASVQQLVMLTYGHTLMIVPQDIRTDADALLAFIRRQRLDQLDCVPSQLKLLLDAGLLDPQAEWTPSIVFPGGEAIDAATWQQLASAPTAEFYNMYGPTECTVDSTTMCVGLAPARPTIGRPLANARVYILDRYLQPVPVGVPGELYIAGAGVGRGYLNRPDLTAERFLPDPFPVAGDRLQVEGSPHNLQPVTIKPATVAGRRMYRTGDRVRWLPDGQIEFLGRVDFQVKLRGFRIELGEIEATLHRHPAVREAVVLVREDQPGHQRLVAYLLPQDSPPTVADLRAHLLVQLPEYMVPAAFVTLDALPLTPNAKVDRRALAALPQPEALERSAADEDYLAPSTPIESTLADAWAQVLGLKRVSVNDNFFELGGDSILSIQVIARAARAGLRLTPKQVFQAPTVAGLATLLQDQMAAAGSADLGAATIPAEQGIVEGALPLTPIQHRFFETIIAPNHWNQSLLVAVPGQFDPAALQGATAAVLGHHDALRLRFTRTEGGWEQINAGVEADAETLHTTSVQGGVFRYVELSAADAQAQAAALQAESVQAQASLDIVSGPLLRIVYLDYGPHQAGRLLVVIHHLAVDRVSWHILLEDLVAAYEQLRRCAPIQLPPKTTAFRDWARRLEEHAQSPAVQAELSYWQAAIARAPALPVDFAGGANREANAVTVSVLLEPQETRALMNDVPGPYGTVIQEALLTALALAFERWAGMTELLVELEGHGRQTDLFAEASMDLSRTAGWFTAIYPLRLSLKRAAGPGEALKIIKEQFRATPHAGRYFGLLQYLNRNPDVIREAAAWPRPPISFNYLGQFIQGQVGPQMDDILERRAPDDAQDALPFAPQTFEPAPERAGPDRAPENDRQYLLDVTASVYQGQLRVEWTYSSQLHRSSSIERLADAFTTALREIIAHCQSSEAGGYTPSDFTDADLSEQDLEGLLAELGETE